MPRVWNPDYKSSSLLSGICDQEFTEWEWNYPDNDEESEPLESVRPTRKS